MIDIKPGTLIRLKEDALVGPPGDERVVTQRWPERHSHTWFPEQIFMFLEMEVREREDLPPVNFIHVLTPDGVDRKRLFTTVNTFEEQIEVLT